MKDQLTAYVDLLFAGADHAEEIKMEILQNTLDRYDDLIEQGKTPQAAYSLAISGIGDPSDIINEKTAIGQVVTEAEQNAIARDGMNNDTRKLLKAISTALYILCPAPLFILGSTFGLVGLLTFVAVATAIAIYCKKDQPKNQPVEQALTPKQKKKQHHSFPGPLCCIYCISSSELSDRCMAHHLDYFHHGSCSNGNYQRFYGS